MRVAFSNTIVLDKFLISPKLYILIIHHPTSSVDISKLIKYYTDGHEVDEDLKTLMAQGGDWPDGSWAGITGREMDDSPTNVYDGVA
jgi:hypothetical protein